MGRSWLGLLPCLVCLGPLGERARADLLEFRFTGTMDSYYDPLNLGLGDTGTFSGSFTYDSSDVDTDPDPNRGSYHSPAITVACILGTWSFSGGSDWGGILVEDLPGHDYLDFSTSWISSGSVNVKQVAVFFNDYSGEALTSDTLPVSTADLQGFTGGGFYINLVYDGGAHGHLTSFTIVPEPGTLATLGLCVLFATSRLSRRR